jgi:alpha-D-ribose 1-methylphosphonate 5-triphosphate synthase subunit PhnG
MKRARRTRILIRGSPELLERLCAQIESAHEAFEIERPNEGLVMLKLQESAKNELFYIGEFLITEAKVQVEGAIGIGMAAGFEPKLARRLAIVDAAANASLPETASWDELLSEEETRIAARDAEEAARLGRTLVNFESMDAEDGE